MTNSPYQIVISILSAIGFGVLSLKVEVLDLTGFLSATVIGSIIITFGGLSWFIILVVFLIFAFVFTKYQNDQKKTIEILEMKGGELGHGKT